MAEGTGEKSGVRIFVLTLDAHTNQVLKTEEEDPGTGKRQEIAPAAAAAAPYVPAAAEGSAWVPPGFTPSVIILVGGGTPVMPAGLIPATVKGLGTYQGALLQAPSPIGPGLFPPPRRPNGVPRLPVEPPKPDPEPEKAAEPTKPPKL